MTYHMTLSPERKQVLNELHRKARYNFVLGGALSGCQHCGSPYHFTRDHHETIARARAHLLADVERAKEKTMPGTIRGKFRCLNILLQWDQVTVVKLMPVTKRHYKDGEPMNFPENAQFWRYSPSGEASIHLKGAGADLSMLPFKLGSYYYVDMTPDETGAWTLGPATTYGENGAGHVAFSMYRSGPDAEAKPGEQTYGELKIGLSGESAKVEHFGMPGKKWRVEFTLAHDHSIES